MVDAGASVEDLRGRTVVRLVVREFGGEVADSRPITPAPRHGEDLVALTLEYRAVNERLWGLAALAVVDRAELLRLDDEKARLCDDLGPAWAERCARPWFLAYARRHGRCPECGDAGRYHDPDTGEAVPLAAPGTPEAGTSGLRDASGWLIALPGLGRRRVGPYAPCEQCNVGTFCTYGDRPLCQGCADAWGTR
jgi:hypothetical protein